MNQALERLVGRATLASHTDINQMAGRADPVLSRKNISGTEEDLLEADTHSMIEHYLQFVVWEKLVANTGRFFRRPSGYDFDNFLDYINAVLDSPVSDICVELIGSHEVGDLMIDLETRSIDVEDGREVVIDREPTIGVLFSKKKEYQGNSYCLDYHLGIMGKGWTLSDEVGIRGHLGRFLGKAYSTAAIKIGDIVLARDSESYLILENMQEEYESRITRNSGRKSFQHSPNLRVSARVVQAQKYVVMGYDENELVLLPIEFEEGKIKCTDKAVGILSDNANDGASPRENPAYVIVSVDDVVRYQLTSADLSFQRKKDQDIFTNHYLTQPQLARIVKKTVYDFFVEHRLFETEEKWRQFFIYAESTGQQAQMQKIFGEFKLDQAYFHKLFGLMDRIRRFQNAGSN